MKVTFDDIDTDRPLTHDLFGTLTRKWSAIYADPPWRFQNRSQLGEERNANQHYDTMTIEDIAAMPVKQLAADDSVLFMWVTDPTLEQAFHVIRSWGFDYRTVGFYWAKTFESADLESLHFTKSFPIGTGYVTRAGPEMILFAARGEPRRRLHNIGGVLKPDMSVRRLQFAPRRDHSEKPHLFYGLIERLYEGPYLELFARHRHEGWGAWGNQVGIMDGDGGNRKRKFERPIAAAPLFDDINAEDVILDSGGIEEGLA